MNNFSHVPPGFRFHPTDEELVDYYLRKKVASKKIDLDIIRDVDLYKIEPWDLQGICIWLNKHYQNYLIILYGGHYSSMQSFTFETYISKFLIMQFRFRLNLPYLRIKNKLCQKENKYIGTSASSRPYIMWFLFLHMPVRNTDNLGCKLKNKCVSNNNY